MTHEEFKKSIKAGVQEAIKTGQAKMRPRSYFIARTTLLIIGAVLLALLLIYLVSFIFFMLRVTGVWFVPAFGAAGIMPFVLALPWLLILVAIIFIITLEWVFKRYSLAWRKPLLYSAVGIVILVLVSGFAVAQTSLHKGAYKKAEEHRLPLIGPMYRSIHPNPEHNIHPGTILEITDDGFLLEVHSGDIFAVIVDSETRLPRSVEFGVDDTVVVIGELADDNQLQAQGVHKIEEDLMFMRPGRNGGLRHHFPKPPFPKSDL